MNKFNNYLKHKAHLETILAIRSGTKTKEQLMESLHISADAVKRRIHNLNELGYVDIWIKKGIRQYVLSTKCLLYVKQIKKEIKEYESWNLAPDERTL